LIRRIIALFDAFASAVLDAPPEPTPEPEFDPDLAIFDTYGLTDEEWNQVLAKSWSRQR
jgi:hypothetical protein